jgi:hypothetical protein
MFYSETENDGIILTWRFYSIRQICQMKTIANSNTTLSHTLLTNVQVLTTQAAPIAHHHSY